MILTIEISDDDIKTLMNMSMTVEDMEETIEGRIACAICRSVNKEASDGMADNFEVQLCEDCISREAMLSLQTEYAEEISATTFWKLRDDIRKLPSVKPKYTDEEIDKAQAVEQAYVDKMVELAIEETKRPKGKWMDIRVIKSFHYDGEPRVRCSRCGNEEEWSSNYCPNCGAEMEGEEDEENSIVNAVADGQPLKTDILRRKIMNTLNGAINDAKARSDYYYSLADEYYSNPDLETEYKLLGERQRQMAAWLTELKNDREILNGLSHYFRTLMMKSIFDERQLNLDMRAATAEERESVKKYIECIGIPTGVNFNDIIEVDKSIN